MHTFKIIGNAFARYAGIVFLMLFFCAMTYKFALIQSNELLTKQQEDHKKEMLEEKIAIYNLVTIKANTKLDLIVAACTEANAVKINQITLYCVPIDQLVPTQKNTKPKEDEYIL